MEEIYVRLIELSELNVKQAAINENLIDIIRTLTTRIDRLEEAENEKRT